MSNNTKMMNIAGKSLVYQTKVNKIVIGVNQEEE
jgi:hypothetical protein